MILVQSFWTKPILVERASGHDNRSIGGWNNRRAYFMAWALSCLQLLKYYKDVRLFTDDLGHELLIELLRLPYTHVDTSLNKIEVDPYIWTYGKLYTYSLQQEPYLHVDSDIFIWDRFDPRIEKGKIVVQSAEINDKYYRPILKQMHNMHMPAFPGSLKDRSIVVYNTGVVGGSDLEFLQHYAKLAMSYIQLNSDHLQEINKGGFAVTIEQWLLHELVAASKKDVEPLFGPISDYSGNIEFFKMELTPEKVKFIHPLAGTKKLKKIENSIEQRLRLLYPEYYFRINELCRQQKI